MKIKITKEQLDLLNIGNVINTNEEKWYYMPFWFKQSGDDFEIISFEKLPKEIKDILNDKKEPNKYFSLNHNNPLTTNECF